MAQKVCNSVGTWPCHSSCGYIHDRRTGRSRDDWRQHGKRARVLRSIHRKDLWQTHRPLVDGFGRRAGSETYGNGRRPENPAQYGARARQRPGCAFSGPDRKLIAPLPGRPIEAPPPEGQRGACDPGGDCCALFIRAFARPAPIVAFQFLHRQDQTRRQNGGQNDNNQNPAFFQYLHHSASASSLPSKPGPGHDSSDAGQNHDCNKE